MHPYPPLPQPSPRDCTSSLIKSILCFWYDNSFQTTALAKLYYSTYMITKNTTRPSFTWIKGSLFLIYGFQIFSVTNNTECGKLLEEIKCALCSPHSQSLFNSPEREALERDLVLPLLCKDYCKEFFYTCRGHIPGKKKIDKLNKLLQHILTRYLILNVCFWECKIYLTFQNTYFCLTINLYKFVTFHCC